MSICVVSNGLNDCAKTQKIIARKGSKQLYKVTSRGSETLVTTLPLVMGFPHENFNHFILHKVSPETLGLAQSTGLMNIQSFAEVMKHFAKVTGSSKKIQNLFYLDDHENNFFSEALEIAKDNGLTILTIPLNTSHKLQPLDLSQSKVFSKGRKMGKLSVAINTMIKMKLKKKLN